MYGAVHLTSGLLIKPLSLGQKYGIVRQRYRVKRRKDLLQSHIMLSLLIIKRLSAA